MSDRLPWEPPPRVSSMAEAIERYLALDFGLVALRARSKFPMLTEWQIQPISTLDQAIKTIIEPGRNVGLNHAYSHTGAFDVDWLAAVERLFAEFGMNYDDLFASYPRIKSREGRDKIIFRLPPDFIASLNTTQMVLRWPLENGEKDHKGRPILATVFELRTGAHQDVLPPSIHPDTGAPYEWHDGQAPWDYPELPELPADHFLITIWREWERFKPQLESACPWREREPAPRIPEPVRHVSQQAHNDIIGQFNRSFQPTDILERNGYQRKGRRWMAPHSKTKIPGVVILKDSGKAFSHHGSDILNTGHAHDAFSLLTILESGGSIDIAIESAAQALGIDRHAPENVAIDLAAFMENTRKRSAAPKKPVAAPSARAPNPQLLTDAPALVRQFLDWGLATAAKPLPHLTLQAAFALLSVVAGRRYRTQYNNWPSLWFLNSELTASGKEHPESLIEIALDAADLGTLLAGSGYTSPGAIFSVLMDKPCHLALIDEFGKLMSSSQAKGNQHKADAVTLLMQIFSSCHKTIRPPAYSAMGLSKDARKELLERKVCNPAVTLLASTTPSTFYGSIDREWVNDGFLGRFIVCHSVVGRQKSALAAMRAPDAALVAGLTAIHDAHVGTGNLAAVELDCTLPARPIELTFSAEAERLLAAVEDDIYRLMDDAQAWGLDPLFGRTREKAMRLSMLAALADDTSARTIGATAMEYAIDYVMDMDVALVEAAKLNVADSPFARVKNDCLTMLRKAGERGLTRRELERKYAAFDALRPKDQMDVLGALASSGLIEPREQSSLSGRGRKREAWVAVEEDPDD